MDIFAHALWTNVAYYKKYKLNLKDRLWAVFFGVMPDLISFTPSTIYLLFHPQPYTMMLETTHQVWAFSWAVQSYNYTHSLVSFFVAMIVVLVFRRGKIYWPLLGWLLHILIDIFTHPSFFATPFLFPISSFRNHYAISWAEPHFMLVNYACIAVAYILIFTVFRKKKPNQMT